MAIARWNMVYQEFQSHSTQEVCYNAKPTTSIFLWIDFFFYIFEHRTALLVILGYPSQGILGATAPSPGRTCLGCRGYQWFFIRIAINNAKQVCTPTFIKWETNTCLKQIEILTYGPFDKLKCCFQTFLKQILSDRWAMEYSYSPKNKRPYRGI